MVEPLGVQPPGAQPYVIRSGDQKTINSIFAFNILNNVWLNKPSNINFDYPLQCAKQLVKEPSEVSLIFRNIS